MLAACSAGKFRPQRFVTLALPSAGRARDLTYNNTKGIIEKTKSSSGDSVFEKSYTLDDLGRLESYLYSLDNNENFIVTVEYLEGRAVENTATTTTLIKKMTVGGTQYEYTYDAKGNITEIKVGGTVRQSYEYDSLNQLTRENNKDTNETVVYSYDNHGNILSKTVYPYNEGEITESGTSISYGYDSSWTDLLVSYNGQSITYDTIGNPLTYRDGLSFTWSGGRKLTGFTLNNGAGYVDGRYIYDDNGIRVYKNINGNETEYYLNGSTILAEVTNYGSVTRRTDYIYDESGSVYGFSVDGNDYYYVKNLMDDVIGILDKSGTMIVSYAYDAYGVPTVSYPGITATMTDAEKYEIYLIGSMNPFRYRSYYFDTETGFYYLNSRYYDPVTGRFINADGYASTGQGVLGQNMFAYCANNPIMSSDPLGYCRIKEDGSFECDYKKIMDALEGADFDYMLHAGIDDNYIRDIRVQYNLCLEKYRAETLGEAKQNFEKTVTIVAGTILKYLEFDQKFHEYIFDQPLLATIWVAYKVYNIASGVRSIVKSLAKSAPKIWDIGYALWKTLKTQQYLEDLQEYVNRDEEDELWTEMKY